MTPVHMFYEYMALAKQTSVLREAITSKLFVEPSKIISSIYCLLVSQYILVE